MLERTFLYADVSVSQPVCLSVNLSVSLSVCLPRHFKSRSLRTPRLKFSATKLATGTALAQSSPRMRLSSGSHLRGWPTTGPLHHVLQEP